MGFKIIKAKDRISNLKYAVNYLSSLLCKNKEIKQI